MNWVQKKFQEDNLHCVFGSDFNRCRSFNISRNNLVWNNKPNELGGVLIGWY